MHESQFRRFFQNAALAAALVVAGAALPSVADAQGTGAGTGDAGMNQTTERDDGEDGNWGWLGLLGLAGLLGMRRRDREHHVVDTTRRPVT